MITENEADGVDDVASEHAPVSAANVHDEHPLVQDPVREGDLFTFAVAVGCLVVVVGLLAFAIMGSFAGVR